MHFDQRDELSKEIIGIRMRRSAFNKCRRFIEKGECREVIKRFFDDDIIHAESN
jgi:hypothetical protein